MIKALSLAAALALLPLSAAVAGDLRGPSEDALEAAAEAFEARMESFGERAEAIKADTGLSEAEREMKIATLWSEYAPDVSAFTAAAAVHAGGIAAEALAEIDLEAVVAEAMAGIETSGILAGAQGMAANGSWASNDPEHMATYGLVADYVIGEVMDELEAVEIDMAEATMDVPAAPEPDAD